MLLVYTLTYRDMGVKLHFESRFLKRISTNYILSCELPKKISGLRFDTFRWVNDFPNFPTLVGWLQFFPRFHGSEKKPAGFKVTSPDAASKVTLAAATFWSETDRWQWKDRWRSPLPNCKGLCFSPIHGSCAIYFSGGIDTVGGWNPAITSWDW